MKGYTKSQIDRIGNAIIFFAERITYLSKTKLLKLLYLTEEESVRAYHKPMFYTDFEVWQFGPVVREVYINLNEDGNMFSDYICLEQQDQKSVIKAKKKFSDDEFSDNDIALLDDMVRRYRISIADDVVDITHREESLWSITAKRHGLIAEFDAKTRSSSDVVIDLSELLVGCEKEYYAECLEAHNFEKLYN